MADTPTSELFTLSSNSLKNYGKCLTFFKSKNVKVFPCAYRGQYGEGKVFDPEARGFTEYNYSHLYSRNEKSSYIIAWEKDANNSYTLKCLLGGYYFEFYHLLKSDFSASAANKKTKKIVLRLDEVDLTDARTSSEDGTRKTKVIGSLVGEHGVGEDEEINSLYLDCQRSGTVNGGNTTAYIFTGVAIVPSDDVSTMSFDATLEPFTYTSDGNLEINWSTKTISDVINTNSEGGAFSIRTLGDTPADISDATGDYSTAFGRGTKASGIASVAFGSYTKASGTNSFAFGDNTEVTGDNSIAFGDHTKANLENMLVLGKYNTGDYIIKSGIQPVLVVGWGEDGHEKDIFRLDSDGRIITKGDLWLDGGIWAKSPSSNYLQLGTTDKTIGPGWITVFGSGTEEAAENPVIFSVDTEGNTKVWGTFFVKGETELKDSLDVQGNITLTGDIASGGKASFKGALKADGITSSGDTDPLNTLTLGSTAKDCGGAITVYGLTESASPIFSVDKVGNTIVAGTLAAGDCTVGAIAMSGDLEIGEDGTVFKVTQGDTNSAELTGDFRATGAISATNSITSTTGNITASSGALEGISLNIGSGTAGISSTGQLTCKESLELTVTIPATTEGGTATTLKMIEASSSGVTVRGALNGRTISIIDATDKTETTLSFVDSVLNINTGATIDGMTTTKGITIVDATSEAPTTASISATGALTVKSIKVGDLFELNSDKAEINAELVFKKGVSLSGVSVSGDIDAGDITAKNITASGVIQGKYYISTSDIRKKCEIKSYVSQNSILDLDIKEFEFIGDESHTKHIGCIAQDLQQICPEIVYTDSDGYLAIEENKLVYLLLQEVKELKKEIKKMKGE